MLLAVQVFFAAVSLMMAVAAQRGATRAWQLQYHPIDLAMRFMSGFWAIFLLVSIIQMVLAVRLDTFGPWLVVVKDTGLEFLLASVSFFLLTAAGVVGRWIFAAVVVQLAGGLIALAWLNGSARPSPMAQFAWTAWHAPCAVLVTFRVVRQTFYTHSRRSWLTLAACVMGLGIWLHEEVMPDSAGALLSAGFYVYAFFLFVVWKLISLNTDADKTLANTGMSFNGTTGFQPIGHVATDDEFITLAVRCERQRIACELHDNVGSHIVGILFSMQAADPLPQRSVMFSLEQCLSDLKMTVDALHSFDESVTTALGRLRYRVQPALDRQAITMRWQVEVCDMLDLVSGAYAQQVLRIAQESLTNVIRHANARAVKVTCRYVPEFCHLQLEVRDNGVGMSIDKGRPLSGRGLEAMTRRATAVGGVLVISSRHARGTCVRLTLPLPHLQTGQKSS